MFRKILAGALLTGAVSLTPARGVQIYTETFPGPASTNFSGWEATLYTGDSGLGYWENFTGEMRLVMELLEGFSILDRGYLHSSSNASGGRFQGNWNAATTQVDGVGFELKCDTLQPNYVQMRLYPDLGSNANPFYAVLPKPPVGVTEAYYLPVSQKGDWFGSPIDTEEMFTTFRTNALKVWIEVGKNGDEFQTYRIDNIFISRAFQWDGGTNGLGTNWLTSTNWFPDGFPGSNSRIIFSSTGAATVVNVDSSGTTGGVVQVGQLFVTESNRTFETASVATNSKMQFNGFGGVFVTAGSNTVMFRNGNSRQLELVGARYRGVFDVAAGGSIVISNVISETNVTCRVDKTGPGLLHLGSSNRFSGGTRVLGGVLQIGHQRALGTNGLMSVGGRVDLNGFDVALPWITGTTGVVSDASASAGTTTVFFAQGSNSIFAGIFSNGPTRVVALVKNGAATISLAGTNLNTGTTTINTGRLLLAASGIDSNGVWAVGELGPGAVLVSTGGIFGGAGVARGVVDNGGTVLPGTGVLVCAGGYLQRTNGVLTFMLAGTNAAQNYQQYTGGIFTNTGVGFTNIVTNTVVQTALYPRLEIPGTATFDGLLRIQFVNGYTPQTGDVFQLITASAYNGFFSTNSLLTNNLPAPGAGREWSLQYRNDGVWLACVATGAPVRAFLTPSIVREGDVGTTNLNFFAALSRPATATVSIAWTASNGTALAGSDYTATNGLLTIPAGFQFGQITIAVLGDTTLEYDETLTLRVTALTNALPGNTNSTGTLLNDDPFPLITIANLTTNEDAATNLIITLTPASGIPASFTYTLADGTALAPADYSPTSAVFTIPAGQTTANLPLPVINDSIYETNENLFVNFSSPSNSTLSVAQITVTLLNDEPFPQLTIAGSTSGEGDNGTRNFPVSITLAPASAFPVSFTIATTTNGSATPFVDFFPTNASYTLPPGESAASITVVVISDPNTEPNENIILRITNTTNATPGTDNGPTILDDDFNPYPGFLGFVQQVSDGLQRGYWDDPDADGQPNIYEYAFLSHPDDSNSVGRFYAHAQGGIPGVRFGRNLNATDIIIELEATEALIEITVPQYPPDPEDPPLPPLIFPVAWYNVATNANGIWAGLSTVTETGTNNPISSFIHDPSPSTLTNRHYRLLVRPPE